eukprot:UN23146
MSQRAPLKDLCDIKVLQTIVAADDPELWDNPSFSAALNFIWNKHLRQVFFKQMVIYIAFVVIWLAWTSSVVRQSKEDIRNSLFVGVCVVTMLIIDLYFVKEEIGQLYAHYEQHKET